MMDSVEVLAFQLVLQYIQWDTGLYGALVLNDFVFWVLGYHFVAIWIDIVKWIIWILPHSYQFQKVWQNSTGLLRKFLQVPKRSIKKQEVNSSNATQMRSSKATYRYPMHSNLGRTHIIDSLNGLLPSPLVNKLNISSIRLRRRSTSTLAVSTIVP